MLQTDLQLPPRFLRPAYAQSTSTFISDLSITPRVNSMRPEPAHTEPVQASGAAVRYARAFQCKLYDANDAKFTTEYDFKFCSDMHVGETYEIHWPQSAAGACGTPYQYQTPFYDGVFCKDDIITLDPLNTFQKIGVQSQVFTVVNDEDYYYPDLIRGMIVEPANNDTPQGEFGQNVAKYTGSTTGTSRDNTLCSKFTPITWQVDRDCHLISASSFDKMCADMLQQRDDLSGDTEPHGARVLVEDFLAANNQQRRNFFGKKDHEDDEAKR